MVKAIRVPLNITCTPQSAPSPFSTMKADKGREPVGEASACPVGGHLKVNSSFHLGA